MPHGSLLTFYMAFQSLCVCICCINQMGVFCDLTFSPSNYCEQGARPSLLDLMLFNPNRVLSFCPLPLILQAMAQTVGLGLSQDGEFSFHFSPLICIFVADTL